MEDFKKGIAFGAKAEESKVEDVDYTEEETKAQVRVNEEDFIQGLIEAVEFTDEETQKIEIVREGKLFFAFSIRPLKSEEYEKCRKKHTKYVRNRQLGMKMPDETDRVKYQSAIIYTATIDEDKAKLWDNKKVWEVLRNKDYQVMNGLDVIEFALKAGEKDKVIEAIDLLSGYESNIEEVAKN